MMAAGSRLSEPRPAPVADGVRIVRPDFDRRIDLPGAGPCPRPVDIDRSRTGFSQLVSLRVYSFAQGVEIDGEAEGDEVFIVLMRGAADLAVSRSCAEIGTFPLRQAEGLRAIYMPPHAAYHLSATADCDIAYARVEPRGAHLPEPRAFATEGGRLEIAGYATAMDLTLATVDVGEVLDPNIDGPTPERFVHLRGHANFTASIAGERLADWDSVTLAEGEDATISIDTGAADILTITASQGAPTRP